MKNKNKRSIYFGEYKKINGIYQYLFHSGTNSNNPVLLYLHGFGTAESTQTNIFQEKWEEIFTVVHLDQRGAGKTFTKNPTEEPTLELHLQDVHETVEYLKKKYHQEKIIILGHSWGSILGSIYIKKHPENVAYYIGTGQVVNVLEGERAGYEKAIEVAQNKKDLKSLKKLESIPNYPYSKDSDEFMKNCRLLRTVQQKYKLAPNFAAYIPIIKALITSPIFEFSDITALIKAGKVNTKLEDNMMSIDFNKEYADYEVPIYYILGANDWQVSYVVSQRYFEKVHAPRKKLYVIPNAGHFTMYDQPELYFNALSDVNKSENR